MQIYSAAKILSTNVRSPSAYEEVSRPRELLIIQHDHNKLVGR